MGSFMDPSNSEMHKMIWDMGREIKDKIQVFTIEMVLNNDFFRGMFKKLYTPIKNKKIQLWRRLLLSIIRKSPRFLKIYFRNKIRANYKLIGVHSGDIELVHKESLKLVKKQLIVPISKQYDAIIFGLPNMTPYNIGTAMNPLLIHTLVLGYLYNMYNGKSPLKKGGTLIVFNPAYGKFDLKQHSSYRDFYFNIIANNHDMFNLKDIERKYIENQEYIINYNESYAYHGIHAPIAYYWGVLGYLNVGKIIIAGAKNKEVTEILGFDHAKSLDDAIEKTLKDYGKSCSLAYFFIPPLFISEFKGLNRNDLK
jgi:hypothetical protein